MKKKINNAKEFALEYKKQLVIAGVLILSTFIVMGICNIIRGSVTASRDEAYNAYIALQNEFTGYRDKIEGMQGYQDPNSNHANEQISYVGTSVDNGKFTNDQQLFWNFIKDAFNYSSTQEYMNIREQYRQVLGDCLFTTNFLDPVAYDQSTQSWADGGGRTCIAQQSNFVLIPIRMYEDRYDYLAYITFSSSNASAQYGSSKIIFTFTIDMNNTLTNFECYPIHANR